MLSFKTTQPAPTKINKLVIIILQFRYEITEL